MAGASPEGQHGGRSCGSVRGSRRIWVLAAALAVSFGLATVPAATLAAPAERPANGLTEYTASLRQATKLAQSARAATAALSGTSCVQVGPAAGKLAEAASAADEVLLSYRKARTRYGTQEEIELLVTLAADLHEAHGRLALAAGESGGPSAKEERAAEGEVDVFRKFIATEIANRLRIAGLADVLTSKSLAAVTSKVVATLHDRLRARAEAELKRLVGLRIKLGVPLKEQIHDFLRRELSRSLAKLALAAGPAGIVIRLFGGRILSLVGAGLKAALRQRGDVAGRTARTLEQLAGLKLKLNALPKDARIDRVRKIVQEVQRALGATGFLEGDLKRSHRTDLLTQLTTQKDNLARTVDFTRHRFLLDSALLGEDFGAAAKAVAAIGADARRLAKKLGCPLSSGGGGSTRPAKGVRPTKGTCLPSSFTMESQRSLPPYDVTGTFRANIQRFEKGQGDYDYYCVWVTDTGKDAFLAVIDFTPEGVPGTAGDCARTRTGGPPYYSRKRHLTVSGGPRMFYTRAAGGDEKILEQVLATAESQGVGTAC